MEAVVRYHPTREQLEVAGAVDESLESLLPLARIHKSAEESEDTWASLDGLGVFAIGLSEDLGGSGLGAAEEGFIAMGLGRRLASPSVLATMGARHAPVDWSSNSDLRGARVAAAYRHGKRNVLVMDSKAEFCLLRGESDTALHKIGARGTNKTIEGRLWLDELRELPELSKPIVRFDAAQILRLRLLDAAALAGIAQAAQEMAVAYAGFREQFGRPIGSFQAVKHHCADMAMAARCARDQMSFAAVAIDDGRPEAALEVECAFLVAGSAAIENAGKNIQIHGGIGFSDEADPHLLLKRAQVLVANAGGLEAATDRIANLKSSWA